MRNKFLIFVLVFFGFIVKSQQLNDLIVEYYNKQLADTTRIKALHKFIFRSYESKPDTALKLAFEELDLANKIKSEFWIGNAYSNIGVVNRQMGELRASIHYLIKSEEFRKKINDARGLGSTYNNLGMTYRDLGFKDSTLYFYNKCLNGAELRKDTLGIISSKFNIAVQMTRSGDLLGGLSIYHEIIKIAEKRKDIYNKLACNSGIADIWYRQKDYKKSIEFLSASIELVNKTKIQYSLIGEFILMAACYTGMDNNEKSLEYFDKAIEFSLKEKNNVYLMYAYSNKANLLNDLKMYSEAFKYLNLTLNLLEKYPNEELLGLTHNNLGTYYIEKREYKKAEENCLITYEVAKRTKSVALNEGACGCLYKVYNELNDDKNALKYHLEYIQYRDSVINEKNTKEITQKTMLFEFEKKEALASAEYEKQQAIAGFELEKRQILLDKNKQSLLLLGQENELKELSLNKSQLELKHKAIESENQKKEVQILNKDKKLKEIEARQKEEALKKQRLITYGVGAGGLLVLALLFFAIKGYIQKQKDNKVIVGQKKEVEKQKDYAEQQHKIAEEQKHLVEEHQKEIIDSINYAQRIQRSLLANTTLLNNNLKDYFIFFKPKDIVSGDFYWASLLSNDQFALVTADSTGHGVPGAIMSMLNIACLNEAVTKGLLLPNQILFETRLRIIDHLKNDGSDQGGKDGMDCSLLCFDFKNKTLTCSAANNPVWIIRENELLEIKPDKMPVGKHDNDKEPFTLHTHQLQSGDIIYALTDGFPDQFGGIKGKKFMSKNLRELLALTLIYQCKNKSNYLKKLLLIGLEIWNKWMMLH